MRDMYKVYYAKEFKRSWKRLAHSGKFKEEEFRAILLTLCSVDALPLTCRDHALKSDMAGRHECHIRGDLLCVYRKDKDNLVLLALDIGTHHELFGK
ncbi:MAG: hypothetical protein A3D65_03655 [Candidatus Lloydbacteria bacterium RIFCSPHIGHO2_02_FULL_50_13]|uniref:Addiction module toxin RelE n=1 Tax=Candidatus Lloydbacteria bacterium RIFCSPHIGHO2_02_FULL_50_13 TaxID=1798661 RepID=A0A1G2D0U6_9BACT|nr:MAG: hypothetical protein A3D65_03655 [Candidatus Lloydbacteria bacterium RIFCSPHIGHO2_02_FULL_50_13]